MKQPPAPPFLFPVKRRNPALAGQVAEGPAVDSSQGQGAGPPGVGLPPEWRHEPGGDIVRMFQHPTFTTMEQLYRVLPQESWFSPNTSPDSPVQFELGAFTVPRNMNLWLMNYEFTIYVQSGIDPGDFVPAQEGRFGGVMGFDVTVMGRRVSNLLYQLDPIPVQTQRQTFDRPPGQRANQAQFNRAAFQSFAATASPGLSLLPVRRARQGGADQPFTMVVKQNDRVGLSCVIFRTVPTPITSIEGRMTGYLIQETTSAALINRLRPR